MKKTYKILEIFFSIILVTGCIFILLIPDLYNLMKDPNTPNFGYYSIFYRFIFYLCYIISLGIIFLLYFIFKNLYKKKSFKKQLEPYLKVIAILFLSIAIILIVKIVYNPTLLSYIITIFTLIISLCIYIASKIIN